MNFTFRRQILQHWAVTANISRTDIQLLLNLLHMSRPPIMYNLLPKTVDTLLKVDPTVGARVSMETFKKKVNRLGMVSKIMTVGRLLHYSIGDAIEGLSPGMHDRWKYLKDLELIHQIDPTFLTKPFAKLVKVADDESRNGLEPLCVLIDVFIDGFNPFKDSKKNFWAVYGMVTCLVNSKKRFEMRGE